MRSVRKGIGSVAALAVLLAACANPPGPSVGTGTSPAAPLASPEAITRFLSSYPPIVRANGVVSTTAAYDALSGPRRLSDRPYSRENGRLVNDVYSYLGLRSPVELAALARLVVRGRVVAIGRPHFNSSDGGFWDPALHEEPGITDIASNIFRDVLFRVDEVWGTAVPSVEPGALLTFTYPGGQVLVTLSEDLARATELGPGGPYVFSSDPPVDLVEGEDALLFLDYECIDGLYGGRYGCMFMLFPAHELYFKYHLVGDQAVNDRDPQFTMPVDELREVVRSNLAQWAGPQPQKGFIPASPHPPAGGGSPPTEEAEPEHGHGEGGG